MLGLIDNVLFEALPYSFLALGLVLTFRYLRIIDLTFAASFAAGPALAGAMLVQGSSFWSAVACALILAAALGCLTLSMMKFLDLDGLLAGLLSSLVGFSIALLFTQGTLSLRGVDTPMAPLRAIDFHWIASGIPLHPSQIVLFAALTIMAKIGTDWFLRSEIGLAFRAMEDEHSRRQMLPSIGISYWTTMAMGIISGNVLCSVSGLLVMLKEDQVTAARGFDALLAVIAAYLFGILLFEKRPRFADPKNGLKRWVLKLAIFDPTSAAIFGVLFYFMLLSLVSRLNIPSSTPKLIMVALVVAGFVVRRWAEQSSRAGAAARTVIGTKNSLFSARHIRVEYPGAFEPNAALRNASLELPAGTATLLVGANGSGKSTLLRFLSGRTEGTGEVIVPAEGRKRRTGERKQLIGYVSQDAAANLASTLSVAENLALYATNGSKSLFRPWCLVESHRMPHSARSISPARDQAAATLSGGQRQVLSISSMLVRNDAPRIVLFDEPLNHLDEENSLACVNLMEQLLVEGRTLLIVQHDVAAGVSNANSTARTKLARLISRTITMNEVDP